MANGSGQLQVSGLTIRQTPQTDQNGNPFLATLVSFSVGPHGPFTLMFPPGELDPTVISAAVQAFVSRILTVLQNISQFNTTLP